MTIDQKMLPGQTPYSKEELDRLDRMFADVLLAEELIDIDELELHSEQYRKNGGRK